MKIMGKNIAMALLIFVVFLMLPNFSYAAPEISGVAGAISDGGNIVLTGTDFGANSYAETSAVEFLGGKNGPIESGTVGNTFSRTNWLVDSYANDAVVYTDEDALFGSKCLRTEYDSGTVKGAPLYFNLPSAVTANDKIFVSWWVRGDYDDAGNYSTGQFKVMRFTSVQSIMDGSGACDIWFFHTGTSGAPYTQAGYNGVATWYWDTDVNPIYPKETWSRIDFYIDTTSPNYGSITKYMPGSASVTVYDADHSSSIASVNWPYIVWQNYFGTDGDNPDYGLNGNVWMDDLYISHGTQARVELCDSGTWSARQTCIIQPASAWNENGQSITTVLNQGSFANGSAAYLYVINTDGAVNSTGRSITFGSSGGDTIAPSTPSGLSVS